MLSWSAPVGVPTPDFGIEQSHLMYAQAGYSFDYGSGPETYRIGTDGPYTHHVDNSSPNATDSDNPFGTPGKPRRTIPTALLAGSVVEIHGQNYDYSLGGRIHFSGQGSAGLPIFVRGANGQDAPRLENKVEVGFSAPSSHIIVENLDLDGFTVVRNSGDHITLRHSEVRDGGGVILASWDGSDLSNLLIYHNEIHDNGDWQSLNEADIHGVTVNQHVRNAWILDNTIYHNGGDAVQVNSGSGFSSDHIYIGRNVMFGDGENAVDIKQSRDVIVSENTIYGYDAHKTSSAGEAIVIHYSPERLWFINNDISASNLGIVNTGANQLYVIGNVIHDIRHVESSYSPTSIYAGGIGYHGRNAQTSYLINNTFYNNDAAIGVGAVAATHLINNIIVENARTDTHAINYIDSNASSASRMTHNLLYQSDGAVRISWGGQLYTSLAAFQSGTGKGAGSLQGDPRLANPAAGDYHLGETSPAIDAATSIETYLDNFYNRYGLSIAMDYDRTSRVQGTAVDIGGDEWGIEPPPPGEANPGATPVAQGMTVSVLEDGLLAQQVLATDDGDDLLYSAIGESAHGTLSLQPNGQFIYAADLNWNGTDSFYFRAYDGWTYSSPAKVTIIVHPVNDAPAARNQTVLTGTDMPVSGFAGGYDVESDALTFSLAGQPANGAVSLGADGDFTYTPRSGFSGVDSFGFRVSDGRTVSNTATVTVAVGSPALEVGTTRLDFGADKTELSFTVRNIGQGVMNYAIVSSNACLLAGPDVGSATTETDTITVRVNRDALTPGWHNATILVYAGTAGSRGIEASILADVMEERTLVQPSATWSYLPGESAPPAQWNVADFDASSWATGAGSIGYSSDITYNTPIANMEDRYVSLFARRSFELSDPSSLKSLTLSIAYDDAFMAYINGVEIARSASMGGSTGSLVAYDATAVFMHDEMDPEELYTFQVPAGLLRAGSNVLAIEIHNIAKGSSDAGFVAGLTGIGHFVAPMPGDADRDGRVDLSDLGLLVSHWGAAGNMSWEQGDFSGDGKVDLADLAILGTNWGGAVATLPILMPGDATGDGRVDLSDLGILVTHWGSTTATLRSGDFTADGNVNLSDLGVLVTNWTVDLPEAEVVAVAPADANGDGRVDLSELGILASRWGGPSDGTPATGDFTGDGLVDLADLGVLATYWDYPAS